MAQFLLFNLILSLFFSNNNGLVDAQILAKAYTGCDWYRTQASSPTQTTAPSLLDTRGAVHICNKSNQPLSTATDVSAATGCQARVNTNNAAYLCDTYQPVPVANDLAYGFAIQTTVIHLACDSRGRGWAAGGDGVYWDVWRGYNWGSEQGGVRNRQECERLPGNLWGGCFWRWNWARGEVNG
ncbi:family 45 putative glycoside hydrolase [Triangularia verruculosa]|uniref:Family 45 putative glycoside hydrolase n=1 Tax=Triangularia verruculosa TaxID=2587418 RepID=A0AAN6XCM4_9PEZI|nr:family 45 putative glycoside hydrolase [Triangularia verruculosa]